MKTVSMLSFRLHAERVLARVQNGERLILTHRGKPVARLEPIQNDCFEADDPFYGLCDVAEPMGTLNNREIDKIVYGQ
jgi:prevent-host-death family protein